MNNQALIVESSLTVRMDLRAALTAVGFAVTACGTLALAQKMLRDKTFSVVILDEVLPDGLGLDLLAHLRSTPDLARLPMVLLGAEPEVPPRIRGVSARADVYIAKPYDRSVFVRRVSALVTRKQAALEEPSSSRSGSLLGKRLLVVDDSPTYLEMLAQLLRLNGCRVTQAHSGEEALEVLAVEQVDCVLMDLLMPGMGGMATAAEIKRTPALADTPVVILTGLEDAEVRAEGVAIGVDDFVLKLPDMPSLTTRLRSLLHKRAEGRSRPASTRDGSAAGRPSPPWDSPVQADPGRTARAPARGGARSSRS